MIKMYDKYYLIKLIKDKVNEVEREGHKILHIELTYEDAFKIETIFNSFSDLVIFDGIQFYRSYDIDESQIVYLVKDVGIVHEGLKW
jgi:hypothetical protein